VIRQIETHRVAKGDDGEDLGNGHAELSPKLLLKRLRRGVKAKDTRQAASALCTSALSVCAAEPIQN
jgi:hypothetical protein